MRIDSSTRLPLLVALGCFSLGSILIANSIETIYPSLAFLDGSFKYLGGLSAGVLITLALLKT